MFTTIDELLAKLKYYLAHEEEREQIAHAGYQRCIQEHTYERRFREIFRRIGVCGHDAADHHDSKLSAVEEVQ
ncbi:MAG: glycosyltransferase family 1 protein [Planctomycetia bacterium]|nr:glycosyltransferase family 1 protein [Planctomycetia bacterium]